MRKPSVYVSMPKSVNAKDKLMLLATRYPGINFCSWEQGTPYDTSGMKKADAVAFINIANAFKMSPDSLTPGCKSEYEFCLKHNIPILGIYRSTYGTNLYSASATYDHFACITGTTTSVIEDLKKIVEDKEPVQLSIPEKKGYQTFSINATNDIEAEILLRYADKAIENSNAKGTGYKKWTIGDCKKYYLHINLSTGVPLYAGGFTSSRSNTLLTFKEFMTEVLPEFQKQYPIWIPQNVLKAAHYSLYGVITDTSGSLVDIIRPKEKSFQLPETWAILASCTTEAEILSIFTNTLLNTGSYEGELEPKKWTVHDSMSYHLVVRKGKYLEGQCDNTNLFRRGIKNISFREFLEYVYPDFKKKFPDCIVEHDWDWLLSQYGLSTKTSSISDSEMLCPKENTDPVVFDDERVLLLM